MYNTCVRSRKWAQNPGMLCWSIINLHYVIQSSLEEGELAEHHWVRDADRARNKRWKINWKRCLQKSQKMLFSLFKMTEDS